MGAGVTTGSAGAGDGFTVSPRLLSASVRALVTGAGGFVGGHLVAHLQACGDVVVADEGPAGDGTDICDLAAVERMVTRARPEVLYHLAGWSDVGGSWKAPVEAFRANAEGTLNVLLASADAAVERVLVVTSADVYGVVAEDDLPLREDRALRPVTPYGASKVAADALALQAWLGRGLPTVRVRAFNHLGPGQSDRFVASAIARRVAENERVGSDIVRVGNVTPRRDFCDVRDVVRAYRLLVERGQPGEAYNVCTGRAVAIAELADRLCGLARRPMHPEPDPALQRSVDVPVLEGDPHRLREATGWAPEIPLERTLADLLGWWRDELAVVAAKQP